LLSDLTLPRSIFSKTAASTVSKHESAIHGVRVRQCCHDAEHTYWHAATATTGPSPGSTVCVGETRSVELQKALLNTSPSRTSTEVGVLAEACCYGPYNFVIVWRSRSDGATA